MKIKRFLGPIFGILVLGALGAGIYLRIGGSGPDEAEAAENGSAETSRSSSSTRAAAVVAIPVSGGEVVLDTLVISVSAAAEAAGWRETRVLAQVGGQVNSLDVRENQAVRRNSRLVALDTTDLALDLLTARAGLATAEADYRERTLFDDQIVDSEIRVERDRVARAKSGIDRETVGVSRAQVNLARSNVKAPFSGRVANINVVQGDWVRQGDELMTIVEVDRIKVEVQVLEGEVGFLREGGGASVLFAAFPDELFTGSIATINPIIDNTTRTARVTVIVPNPEGKILPGMYAQVSLEARRFPDRILVPKEAVLERSSRTMLFVYEPEGRRSGLAKWHYVTTGLENDSLIEIVANNDTDMLEPGQIVLTDGHYTLIHDATVRVVEDVRASGGRPQ